MILQKLLETGEGEGKGLPSGQVSSTYGSLMNVQNSIEQRDNAYIAAILVTNLNDAENQATIGLMISGGFFCFLFFFFPVFVLQERACIIDLIHAQMEIFHLLSSSGHWIIP